MEFQAVKGTRDFYPDVMRRLNWICDAWRRVSLRNGFEEFDAPIFEYLDLFTAKSGPEIAEQLFSLTDRGGRNLAIRPEITPSLARMVNAKINSLPRPIKWFSIPRVCRAENPQKGRLREFFQWNVDIIGEDSEIADAECAFVLVDFLREVGLTPADVQVRYSSRELLAAVLQGFGIADEQMQAVLGVLDKRRKILAEAFDELLRKAVPAGAVAGLTRFLDMGDAGLSVPAAELAASVGIPFAEPVAIALGKLSNFGALLKNFGIAEWCTYDTGIVRGLAYYTGIVYEVFDAAQSLRAVAGGGRYDNLLEVLGGPKVGATGFGMGDVVLGILLDEKGKMPALAQTLDYYVIDDGENLLPRVLEVVGKLRAAGLSAEFSYARRAVGKQMKEANKRGAMRVLIVACDRLSVKDLATGEQRDVTLQEIIGVARS